MPKSKTKGNTPAEKLKLIHPQSRKAQQMQRKVHRQIRQKKQRKETHQKQNLVGGKVLWFQENLKEGNESCTVEETLELIERYLGRFDEELEQIELKNCIGQRKTNQHANRVDAIGLANQLEKDEFEGAGLEIPDILDPLTLQYLREWQGEAKYLQNLKMKRYCRKELEGEVSKKEMDTE